MGRLHGDVGAGLPRGLDTVAELQVSSTPTPDPAENINNPFRGWGDDDRTLGRRANELWRNALADARRQDSVADSPVSHRIHRRPACACRRVPTRHVRIPGTQVHAGLAMAEPDLS